MCLRDEKNGFLCRLLGALGNITVTVLRDGSISVDSRECCCGLSYLGEYN